MNSTELATLKTYVKLCLRISTTTFDSEIENLIMAAELDLKARNAMTDYVLDPMIKQAISTYVRAHFGEPENPERLLASYHEQLGKLMATTNYTDWEKR